METGRSWCHSIISKANGAYMHLGGSLYTPWCSLSIADLGKKQLEVTVEMPVHISWRVFLKVQYKVINRAVAAAKIISTQEFLPHE